MFLDNNKIEKLNQIRKFLLSNIINIESKKCDKCNGTGLSATFDKKTKELIFWDCVSFCDSCSGLGFINDTVINDTFFPCRNCNGTGIEKEKHNCNFNINIDGDTRKCTCCNGTGFIDWISFIFREDKK